MADGTFDAVLSQLVVSFLDDPQRGVGEMRRVARPGGVVAACAWDYAGGMTLLRRFWDAALVVDRDGAAARDEGRVMRFCSPHELRGLWVDAGFEGVKGGKLTVSARYQAFDALWGPLEHGVGPAGVYAAALEPPRREALRDELRRLLGAPSGPFTRDARVVGLGARAGLMNCGTEEGPRSGVALMWGALRAHSDPTAPHIDAGRANHPCGGQRAPRERRRNPGAPSMPPFTGAGAAATPAAHRLRHYAARRRRRTGAAATTPAAQRPTPRLTTTARTGPAVRG